MFCNISVNITNLSLTLSHVNIAYSYPIRTLLLCVLDVLSSALMCCDVFALFALRSLSGYPVYVLCILLPTPKVCITRRWWPEYL